jgi:CubicO group peptidase (beta-lactamase class C family)
MRSAVVAVLLAGCEPSGEIPIHKEPPLDAFPETNAPSDPELTATQRATLDGYLDAQHKSHGWPSMSVGVVFGDTLVYRRELGEEHAVYRVGSITKVMTGVALLQLRDRGKLSLDDAVTKYVPELTGHAAVTLRHLVTHTSGIPSTGDGSAKYWTGDHDITEAELLAAIKNAPLDFAPGTKVAYSNFAVSLAGLVIARVSGEPYRDVMEGSVFVPLHMVESSFDGGAKGKWLSATGYTNATTTFRLGAAEAAGGVYSTLDDLAKFVAFEARAESGLIDLDSVLSRASLKESQRPDPKFPPFGVNWLTGKDDLGAFVTHNGSVFDYSASVQLYPEKRAGVVALLATGNAEQLDCVAQRALGALFRTNAPEPCVPALTAWNRTALDRVKALFATPNATDVDAAFSPTFPTSRADLLKFFEDCNATYGACTADETVATADNGTARVKLTCAKAGANVLIGADPSTQRIDTLFVAK